MDIVEFYLFNLNLYKFPIKKFFIFKFFQFIIQTINFRTYFFNILTKEPLK